MKFFCRCLVVTALSVLLAACGGGGNSDNNQTNRIWNPPELIENSSENTEVSDVVFDSKGNALAVWMQDDGTGVNSIYGNLFSPGSGWGTEQLIETGAGDAKYPIAAFDSDNNALVVWYQDDGSVQSIYANRFTAASASWGTPVLLETSAFDALYPTIATDGSGNALALWTQDDSTGDYVIYANRYTSAGGWGNAEQIDTNIVQNLGAGAPQVAFDADSNAIAVWAQTDGPYRNLYASRYTPAGGWDTAEVIEDSVSPVGPYPQLAIDGDGNALVVCNQYETVSPFYSHVLANQYTPANGWGSASLIESSPDNVQYYPQVAYDDNGNAFVLWAERDSSNEFLLFASRYTPAGGWGEPGNIDSNSVNSLGFSLAVARRGNALVVSSQGDGSGGYDIHANEYSSSDGWSPSELVETETGYTRHPLAVFDADGTALAVWEQGDVSIKSIYAARYE